MILSNSFYTCPCTILGITSHSVSAISSLCYPVLAAWIPRPLQVFSFPLMFAITFHLPLNAEDQISNVSRVPTFYFPITGLSNSKPQVLLISIFLAIQDFHSCLFVSRDLGQLIFVGALPTFTDVRFSVLWARNGMEDTQRCMNKSETIP